MITQHRAAPPLKALLLAGAMAFGAVALSTAASAATYDANLVDGIFYDIALTSVTGGVNEVYKLTFDPAPSVAQPGHLEVSGSTRNGLLLSGIYLTSGSAYGETGYNLVASANNPDDFKNGTVSASFTWTLAPTSMPLFLTFDWSTNSGKYDGSLYFTAGSPITGVPGPIAGAGIPAAFAFGGLLWARRRKTAAA